MKSYRTDTPTEQTLVHLGTLEITGINSNTCRLKKTKSVRLTYISP